MHLSIKKKKCGWMIFRKEIGSHAHVPSKQDAINIIKCIRRGVMPRNKYYIGSCRRLLTDKEFNDLRSKKKKQTKGDDGNVYQLPA